MITGRGQLKIDGVPLEVSFTVPAGPCTPLALLPEVQRLADQVTDLAVARAEQAGHRISCTKGCGACCRQLVPVSPAEAWHLADLVSRLPPDKQEELRARFKAAQETLTAAALGDPGHPDSDKPAYRAFGLGYFRMGVACPFLEEERCSIHADRPLVCREYLVTSPPAGCAVLGSGQVHQVPVPLRPWAVFSRSVAEHGKLEWMPLIDALDHAGTHGAPAPFRTGPEWVERLLKACQE